MSSEYPPGLRPAYDVPSPSQEYIVPTQIPFSQGNRDRSQKPQPSSISARKNAQASMQNGTSTTVQSSTVPTANTATLPPSFPGATRSTPSSFNHSIMRHQPLANATSLAAQNNTHPRKSIIGPSNPTEQSVQKAMLPDLRRGSQSMGEKEEGELSEVETSGTSLGKMPVNRRAVMQGKKNETRSSSSTYPVMSGKQLYSSPHSPPQGPRANPENMKEHGHIPVPAQDLQAPSGRNLESIQPEYLAALRTNAKEFVMAWHQAGYAYAQLVKEDLDADFLAGIYEELGLDVTKNDQVHKNSLGNSAVISTQRAVNPNLPPKPPASEKHSIATPGQLVQPGGNTVLPSPVLTCGTTDSVINVHAKPSPNGNQVMAPVKSSLKMNQSNEVLVKFPKESKPSVLQSKTVDGGPAISKPQSIAGDRQEYIARLNAAKVKKSAGQSDSTTPVMPTLTKQASPSEQMDFDSDQTLPNGTMAIAELIPEQITQTPAKVSSPDAKFQAAELSAAEKRNAQTELARLRIQALIAAKSAQPTAVEKKNHSLAPKMSYVSLDGACPDPIDVEESVTESLPEQAQDPASVAQSVVTNSGLHIDSATPLANPEVPTEVNVVPLPAAQPIAIVRPANVQNSAPSRIPGLFMTSPLPSEDNETSPIGEKPISLPTVQSTAAHWVPPPPRKRPVASDFDYGPSLQLHKRPFGQPRNLEDDEGMIIEVSEDESTEDESVESGDDASKLLPQTTPSLGTTKMKAVVLPAKAVRDISTPPSTVSVSATEVRSSTPLPVNDDLQVREQRILLMKKRIAEMEKKRNAKVSGFTTPATPREEEQVGAVTARPMAAEVNRDARASSAMVLVTPTNEDQISALTVVEAVAENSPSDTRSSIAIPAKSLKVPVLLLTKVVDPATVLPGSNIWSELDSQSSKHVEPPATAVDPLEKSKSTASSDSLQSSREKRKNEIHTNLPVLNASLTNHKTKLEMLRQQMKELEDAMLKESEDKERLVRELENIGIDTSNMSHEDLQSAKDEILESTEAQAEVPPESGLVPNDENRHANVDPNEDHHLQNSAIVAMMIPQGNGLPLSNLEVTGESKIVHPVLDDNNDDAASGTDESMSLGSSSDGNEIPTLEARGEQPTINSVIQLDDQIQQSGHESSDVVMLDSQSSESEGAESESSYAPELHSPVPEPRQRQTELQSQLNVVSVVSPTESLSRARGIDPEVPTVPSKPILDSQIIDTGEMDDEVSSKASGTSDEDDYEPPEAETAEAFSDKMDDAPSESSDSDYEPPDMVLPIRPHNVDKHDPTLVATNNAHSAPIHENEIANKADKLQQFARDEPIQDPSEVNMNEEPHGLSQYHRFTPYQSPLIMFKSFRYHPEFANIVAGGIHSLTYSHRIDPNIQLCAYEVAGGVCNDAKCEAQHFRSMSIGDDEILKQIGTSNPGRTEAEKQDYIKGLRLVISGLRPKNIKDAAAVAAEIFAYRRNFLNDPTRILNL